MSLQKEEFTTPPEYEKAIAFGLPLEVKFNGDHSIDIKMGSISSFIYFYLLAPIEDMLGNGHTFLVYEGSYWKSLWHYIKGDFS
jgi:hypothetical protein